MAEQKPKPRKRTKGPAPTGKTPVRQIGRHDDQRHDRWRAAAEAAGQSWTAWAAAALDAAADRAELDN